MTNKYYKFKTKNKISIKNLKQLNNNYLNHKLKKKTKEIQSKNQKFKLSYFKIRLNKIKKLTIINTKKYKTIGKMKNN